MRTSEVLERAADLLERGGWIQGRLRDGDGGHCAVGAVAGLRGVSTRDQYQALDRLEENIGGKTWVWNDAEGRTADEVIERFRKVAAEARWTEDVDD